MALDSYGFTKEEIKEMSTKYSNKIQKYKKVFSVLRDLINQRDSFLYDLDKPASYLLDLDSDIKKLIKKLPEITQRERELFMGGEYDLVKQYMFCLYCKLDLTNMKINNEDMSKRVVCNDCGYTYYKQKTDSNKDGDLSIEIEVDEDNLDEELYEEPPAVTAFQNWMLNPEIQNAGLQSAVQSAAYSYTYYPTGGTTSSASSSGSTSTSL